MEWTAAELAEARSVIARVSDAYNSGVGSSSSACDTKHDRIMRELQARFPSRTMVQVIDLYVNLTVETAAQPQDAGSAGDAAAVVHPTFAGGMPVVNNYRRHGAWWCCYGGGGGGGERRGRLFLTGMRVYGRGDWRNISRYFVRSKTPEQISMYADNYFHMMEIAAAMEADGGDDDDGHHEINNNNNNLGGGQAARRRRRLRARPRCRAHCSGDPLQQRQPPPPP
ncbi:hypothetical protein OsJ_20305 [Oryza sativa Japonica Group]|uniref:HTH 3-helical bundle domain-containing protein n=1 Tax=Oryza sativa subsp. japonica TaxID=39947 RepID=B9FRS7_ORYSJ|nr:hypothetical protein OsJ_20305 [Oryza sativa Japonica Group]